MNNPQVDTVYKTYIDAYHAAAALKKQDTGVDTVVRIEKAPYSDGYVVRSIPAFLETPLSRLVTGVPGTPVRATSRNPGYSDKR